MLGEGGGFTLQICQVNDVYRKYMYMVLTCMSTYTLVHISLSFELRRFIHFLHFNHCVLITNLLQLLCSFIYMIYLNHISLFSSFYYIHTNCCFQILDLYFNGNIDFLKKQNLFNSNNFLNDYHSILIILYQILLHIHRSPALYL